MQRTTASTSRDLLARGIEEKAAGEGLSRCRPARNNKQSVGAVSQRIPSKESKNDGNSAKNILKKKKLKKALLVMDLDGVL